MTSIDEADAKLLKWLVKNPSAYPHEIEGMARRIYGAVIEQERQQAEAYRAEMVRAQEWVKECKSHHIPRIAKLERLNLEAQQNPTVNVNSEEAAVQTGEISEAQWRFIQRDAETHGPRTSR